MRRLLSATLRGATKPVALGIALTISFTSFQAVADQIVARMSGHWSPAIVSLMIRSIYDG